MSDAHVFPSRPARAFPLWTVLYRLTLLGLLASLNAGMVVMLSGQCIIQAQLRNRPDEFSAQVPDGTTQTWLYSPQEIPLRVQVVPNSEYFRDVIPFNEYKKEEIRRQLEEDWIPPTGPPRPRL